MNISKSALHAIPKDLTSALESHPEMHKTWEDITPLARNEWICWITSAKKQETKDKRLRIAKENLSAGKRRPCCWPGCSHRNDT